MKLTPIKLWLSFFGFWGVLLSGALSNSLGAPGVWQVLQLRSQLQQGQKDLVRLENELQTLQGKTELLEKHKPTLRREIRRVLGYGRPEEIEFVFTSRLAP